MGTKPLATTTASTRVRAARYGDPGCGEKWPFRGHVCFPLFHTQMFVGSAKDLLKGAPGGSVLRSPPAVQELQEVRLSPWVGKVPGEGSGNPLQYSCLENAMDKKSLAGYSPRGGPESNTMKVPRYKHVKAVDQKLIPGAGSFRSVESLWRIAGLLLTRDKASVLFERE